MSDEKKQDHVPIVNDLPITDEDKDESIGLEGLALYNLKTKITVFKALDTSNIEIISQILNETKKFFNGINLSFLHTRRRLLDSSTLQNTAKNPDLIVFKVNSRVGCDLIVLYLMTIIESGLNHRSNITVCSPNLDISSDLIHSAKRELPEQCLEGIVLDKMHQLGFRSETACDMKQSETISKGLYWSIRSMALKTSRIKNFESSILITYELTPSQTQKTIEACITPRGQTLLIFAISPLAE